MSRILLFALFGAILVAMLGLTIYASLDRSLLNVGSQLLNDRWFQATLADAYFGFLTFFAWVAYKETTMTGRLVWLVLILCLGNIAMSVYMLIALFRWDPRQGAPGLLLRAPS